MRRAKNSTEVLKAALWMLENVGWVKGHYEQYDPSRTKTIAFCAEGAVLAVEVGDKYGIRHRALDRLQKVCKFNNVIVFNDDKNTTKKMIVNAFKRAIKKGSK
jgi:hypothetical protein